METLTIDTIIPINEILVKVQNTHPTNKCEFENKMAYIIIDTLLQKIKTQLSQQGGGRRKKRKATGKRRVRLNKTLKKKQKGGFNPALIVFLMSFLVAFSNGLRSISDEAVVNRLKEANEAVDLFRNDYGTCAVNSLLFLKSINLNTFGELSLDVMSGTKKGMTHNEIATYLSGSNLVFETQWTNVNVKTGNIRGNTNDRFIASVKKIMKPGQISLMTYGFKSGDADAHAVVIWLTNENELVIIDPQKFVYNGIVLYTTGENGEPISDYINDYIDLNRKVNIFTDYHVEIEEEKSNKKIIDTIAKINGYKEYL